MAHSGKNTFLNIIIILGIGFLMIGGYLYYEKYQHPAADNTGNKPVVTEEQLTKLRDVSTLCQEEKFAEAEKTLREMIAENPDNYKLQHELGVVLGLQHKFKESIDCFNTVIAHEPDMVLCYFNRAQAKLLSGQFREAYQEYASVKILFPQAKSQADKGIEILEKVKKLAEQDIKNKFEKKATMSKSDVAALMSLGKMAMEEKHYDKAKEYFSKAVEFKPTLEGGYFGLANVMISEKKFDEAITVLEKYKKENPDNLNCRITLGYTYLKSGKTKKADQEFNEILKVHPDNVECTVGLGLVNMLTAKDKQAEKFFKEAIKKNPDYHAARNLLGVCLIMQGKFDEAITQFTYIVEHDKTFFMAYRNLGDAYLRKADYAGATEYYKKYLELVPDDPDKQSLEEFINSQAL